MIDEKLDDQENDGEEDNSFPDECNDRAPVIHTYVKQLQDRANDEFLQSAEAGRSIVVNAIILTDSGIWL